MSEHAVALPPSSMQRRMACPGSLALEEREPDSSSEYADEGTAAHTLAAWTLNSEAKYSRGFLGRMIEVVNGDVTRTFEADEDMCEHVQTYVDAVMGRLEEYRLAGAVKVTLMVEQRVDFSQFSGVATYRGKPDSFGTSDIIILVQWADGTCLLDVEDLKYGMGVQVYADQNEQMLTYALGALARFDMTHNITRVRCVIHQPRLGHVDEYECTIDELLAFAERMKAAADTAVFLAAGGAQGGGGAEFSGDFTGHLNPGEKQCKFCKAKGTCPALRGLVFDKIGAGPTPEGDFEDLSADVALATQVIKQSDNAVLDALYPHIDTIYDWCSGVLAAIDARLRAGEVFVNAKLVEGKKSGRKWIDADDATKALKSMRLKIEEMYDLKLISPTSAEKLLKKDNPRRWAKLQPLITQTPGKPSVAPASDKREALKLKPVSEMFSDTTLPGADLV